MPILIFLLWIVLNGRITPEILVFGAALAAAFSFFSWKVFGSSMANDMRVLRHLPLFILYAFNLIWEILKASISVMEVVIRQEKPDPVIVEFDSGFHTRLQNVLLANSITLTPGTVTLFEKDGHFTVHCLRREFAEGMDRSSFIRLLGRLSA